MTSALAIGKLCLITLGRRKANHLSGTSFVITKKVRPTGLLSVCDRRILSLLQRLAPCSASRLEHKLIHFLGIDSSRRTAWL